MKTHSICSRTMSLTGVSEINTAYEVEEIRLEGLLYTHTHTNHNNHNKHFHICTKICDIYTTLNPHFQLQ